MRTRRGLGLSESGADSAQAASYDRVGAHDRPARQALGNTLHANLGAAVCAGAATPPRPPLEQTSEHCRDAGEYAWRRPKDAGPEGRARFIGKDAS
jgi:hypothetical protein